MSHTRILTIFVGMCFILCLAKVEITIDRAEITDLDPEIIKLSYVVNRYNRTFKTLSVNFTLIKYMGYDVKMKWQGYALFSNEYRRVPAVLDGNLCDVYVYKNKFPWLKSQIEKTSHFPTKCKIRPGNYEYYMKDFAPNGADFPAVANFPWTKVLSQVQMFYKDKHFITVKSYLTLDQDVELKRMG